MLTRILLFSALILLVTSLSPLFCQSIVDPATVVEALAWSPDGSMIGAGYADGRLDLFDTRTGTILRSIHTFSTVNAIDWSPSQPSLLAVGGNLTDNPGVVVIVDSTTGDFRFMLNAGYSVGAVSWSPSGERIAASSNNAGASVTNGDEVLIWDSGTGELLTQAPLGVYGHNVTAIDWSPDGSQIVGGASNYTLVIWDATSGERLNVVPETGVVVSLDWSTETNELAVSVAGVDDRNTHVWDTDSWTQTLSIPANSATVQWQPGSTQLALGQLQQLQVFNVETAQAMLDLPVSGAVKALAYSPFGSQLAFGGLPVPDSGSVTPNSLSTNSDTSVRTTADGSIGIVVPNPSPAGLEAVATACNAPPAVVSTLTAAAQAEQFESLSALVEVLGVAELPLGCAADMQAVIEAMAAQ